MEKEDCMMGGFGRRLWISSSSSSDSSAPAVPAPAPADYDWDDDDDYGSRLGASERKRLLCGWDLRAYYRHRQHSNELPSSSDARI